METRFFEYIRKGEKWNLVCKIRKDEGEEGVKIGLVSYRCENKNPAFNMRQIERALKEASGKAELLCFGEAFLQGFDCLCWDYEKDKDVAVSRDSETFWQLKRWTVQYGCGIATGYIEREGECLYSSYAVIADGEILHNYRRISKGWKEFTITDEHYREGTKTQEFRLKGQNFMPVLCGDLWDYPEKFKTEGLLLWPVYVNYTPQQWEEEMLPDYADHAGKVARRTLLINPLDDAPKSYGGAFYFRDGEVVAHTKFDEEAILMVEI